MGWAASGGAGSERAVGVVGGEEAPGTCMQVWEFVGIAVLLFFANHRSVTCTPSRAPGEPKCQRKTAEHSRLRCAVQRPPTPTVGDSRLLRLFIEACARPPGDPITCPAGETTKRLVCLCAAGGRPLRTERDGCLAGMRALNVQPKPGRQLFTKLGCRPLPTPLRRRDKRARLPPRPGVCSGAYTRQDGAARRRVR